MQFNRPLKLSVPSLWDLLGDVRQQVASHLQSVSEELRDAAVMAASELVENAIKYGRSITADGLPASLEVELSDVIRLTITSSVRNEQLANETIDRIDAIKGSPDRLALYESRMEELMRLPFKSSTSQLGLLRVAGEGSFELEGKMVGTMLQIVATRRVN